MKYRKLTSIYYENKSIYDEKYTNRINGEETVILPLDINGNRAFYVHNSQVAVMLDNINMLVSDINILARALPNIAIRFLQDKFLIEEINTTYTMEGVHSSKREVSEALKSDNKQVRFYNMVMKYKKMFENVQIDLSSPEKLRKLYDEIIIDEIDTSDYPDGELFRKNDVYVQDNRPDGRTKHTGVKPPEENITLALEKALSVLNSADMPYLVKIAILHYYIGYIHPFYDGNGRLDRYISSCLIARYVNPYVSMRISNTIKSQKNRYDNLFDECNNKISKGDLTPFVIGFVDIVQKTAGEILVILTELESKLSTMRSKTIDNDDFVKKYDLKKIDEDLINLFIQNDLFAEAGLLQKEILEIMKGWNYKEGSVKSSLKKLLSSDLPIKQRQQGKYKIYIFDTDEL